MPTHCASLPSLSLPTCAHGPSQDFTVRPLNDALGAEIVGIDLGVRAECRRFCLRAPCAPDHHLVVFRDQRITPRQHIDFSRRLAA